MENPFKGIFGEKKDDSPKKPKYTGEQELSIDPRTGEVKSPELEKLDKTFEDR